MSRCVVISKRNYLWANRRLFCATLFLIGPITMPTVNLWECYPFPNSRQRLRLENPNKTDAFTFLVGGSSLYFFVRGTNCFRLFLSLRHVIVYPYFAHRNETTMKILWIPRKRLQVGLGTHHTCFCLNLSILGTQLIHVQTLMLNVVFYPQDVFDNNNITHLQSCITFHQTMIFNNGFQGRFTTMLIKSLFSLLRGFDIHEEMFYHHKFLISSFFL